MPNVFYNSSYAASFHTYKVLWTKTWMAWMVDTTVYRNISYAPWRPQARPSKSSHQKSHHRSHQSSHEASSHIRLPALALRCLHSPPPALSLLAALLIGKRSWVGNREERKKPGPACKDVS